MRHQGKGKVNKFEMEAGQKNDQVCMASFLIATSLLLSYTHSLTDLSESGVESRLGNMGNSQWLLLFTSVGKAYECMRTISARPSGQFYLRKAA